MGREGNATGDSDNSDVPIDAPFVNADGNAGSSARGHIGDWTRRLRREPSIAETPPAMATQVHPLDAAAIDSAGGFAAEHVRRYIASAGEDDGWDGPKPILILYTKGRKSGELRRNPLLFFEHGGARFIIGSKGGDAHHPAWFLNLLADANVHVRVLAELYAASAIPVDAQVRAQLWPLIAQRYPMFADYQASTQRQIPLVRLVPVTG